MKQWEMNLYTAILTSDMYGQAQKSHSIMCNHIHFESEVPQEMADQMFKHLIVSNNEVGLAFLQKTNHPSLPTLKTCLQSLVRNNVDTPAVWNWINDVLKRHSRSDIKMLVKPIRVLENTFRSSVKKQISSRCLRALQPYLDQKEIDALTLFARSNGHTLSSRALLKQACLDEVEKMCDTYYTPNNTDLLKIRQEIEVERSKRLKKVLKNQLTGPTVNVKRKM